MILIYRSYFRVEFSEMWKTDSLSRKYKDDEDQNTAHEIRLWCMPDTAGKFLEELVRPIVYLAVQTGGDSMGEAI